MHSSKALLSKNFQIALIFVTLSLEYSIINIDFYFLANISFDSITAVSSVLWLVLLIQTLIGYFVISQLDNALFFSANNTKTLSKLLSVSFITLMLLTLLIIFLVYWLHDIFIYKLYTSSIQKQLSVQYILYMLPFLGFFACYQFFGYVLYSLNKPYYNLIYTIFIVILNIVLNYCFLKYTNLQIIGVAIASSLSVIIILPFYVFTTYKNNIKITFIKINNDVIKKTFIGFKRLSIAAILEPILYRLIQSYIILLLSQFVVQSISARVIIANYLSYSIALATAFAIYLQFNTSKMLNTNYNKTYILKHYKIQLKQSLLLNILLTSVIVIFLLTFKGHLIGKGSYNNYLVTILLLSLIIEPLRNLSIISKAYLKGWQQANIALMLSIFNKLFIQVPLLYLSSLYLTNNAANIILIVVLSIEALAYLLNFLFYSLLSIYLYKKHFIIAQQPIKS